MWRDGEHVIESLENTFNDILNRRMSGLPLLNPKLSVQAVGFSLYDKDWLGILITPWFMNLMLLPGENSDWPEKSPGAKFEKRFPYGSFEFTSAFEAQLGPYALCSLFSPMFQFENQQAALDAARAALQGLLAKQNGLSRRHFLLNRHGSSTSRFPHPNPLPEGEGASR